VENLPVNRPGPVPLTIPAGNAFDVRVAEAGGPLRAAAIDTLQLNIGLTCNLACRHCHVESSPTRPEQMTWETMSLALAAAGRAKARTIDITGGAPEMNPHFRELVRAARRAGFQVIVRTNLTIMLEEGYTDLPAFFAGERIQLIASLPCYLAENVNQQRGPHVYEESIEVLRKLNAVGYGVRPELVLDLIYNPLGPSLPPPQAGLEDAYRQELRTRFGIAFTRLFTITNMPIGRFHDDLARSGRAEAYEAKLRDNFNPATLTSLMCRWQVHVSWDGTLHDCDFNYALGLPVDSRYPRHIRDFVVESLADRRIATGAHCFGCTAGHGSSCCGALV
jgi:radical SAM/Cys-rich protein